MRKIINCGKIDWNGTGRRVNVVELELELRRVRDDMPYEFSCSCSVWNLKLTDIVAGGQCLDEVFRYPEMKPYAEIHELWKKHHLNCMHAGSPKQEAAIEKWRSGRKRKPFDYVAVCEMLEKQGLLVDESYVYDGKPYVYGTAWLTVEIPEDDLAKIEKWMS